MLNECNGCEYKCSMSNIDICTLGSPCPHQRSTPMTEQEYLQTCDTEELATFLAIVQYDGTDLTLKKNHVEKWVEWLKQPHQD